MKEKLLKWLKNPRVIMVLSVFTLTMLAIGVSYSAFLTIKSNTNSQTVQTGTLNVTYSEGTNSFNKVDMQRMSDKEALEFAESSLIYIQNTGTLDSNYYLTVGYDVDSFAARQSPLGTDKLTPLEYIKIAVYDYVNPQESNLILGPVSLADLTVFKADANNPNNNRYLLLFDKINAISGATKTYKVKMWLSSEATSFASKSFFYVNSQVTAEVDETKVAYTFKGNLYNSDMTPITNAKININNSLKQDISNGTFNLGNVLPGTYSLEITANNKTYQTTFTLVKTDTVGVLANTSSFTATQGAKLENVAYTYGTTINALKKANGITDTASTFTFASGTYQIPKNFIINGASSSDIGNLNIILDNDTISNITLN